MHPTNTTFEETNSTTPYPLSFTPLELKNITLPNRFVMGSMHTGLEETPNGFARLATFYAERAQQGVGLIITGGIGPNDEGCVVAGAAKMVSNKDVDYHRVVTDAVHQHNGIICMQILHAGRYGYNPALVAPSAIQSPITPFVPKELTSEQVEAQIEAFVKSAVLAQQAGYDGVEIMGSEGYFINQFLAARTNKREDQWGGSFANRMRLPLEIVQRVRQAVGDKFLIIYRISMLDLVEGGSTLEETLELAQALESIGVDIFNTGICWHEARIPTIAAMVPRAAFTWVSKRLKTQVSTPVITCNRINDPSVAEAILARGDADMVSMARPFLADEAFVAKAKAGKASEINTCIGCNQACLDHTFQAKLTSCLVNPRACHETEISYMKTNQPQKIAIVGAGPAGLSAACVAAQRGHSVVLFEAQDVLGGQFNFAKKVPGKEEFYETLRYFNSQLAKYGVDIRLNTKVTVDQLKNESFDHVVLASGVLPRELKLDGIDHAKVIGYQDVFHGAVVGQRVAIIGAGGIGFDMAEYLSHDPGNWQDSPDRAQDLSAFLAEWGIDADLDHRGGLDPAGKHVSKSFREIILLQRKTNKMGAGLGKTTGWIHRMNLKKRGVHMLTGVDYKKIDDQGLHIVRDNEAEVLEVDTIVICAGQISQTSLLSELESSQLAHTVIGGAFEAGELDAKRAIDQGVRTAAAL